MKTDKSSIPRRDYSLHFCIPLTGFLNPAGTQELGAGGAGWGRIPGAGAGAGQDPAGLVSWIGLVTRRWMDAHAFLVWCFSCPRWLLLISGRNFLLSCSQLDYMGGVCIVCLFQIIHRSPGSTNPVPHPRSVDGWTVDLGNLFLIMLVIVVWSETVCIFALYACMWWPDLDPSPGRETVLGGVLAAFWGSFVACMRLILIFLLYTHTSCFPWESHTPACTLRQFLIWWLKRK